MTDLVEQIFKEELTQAGIEELKAKYPADVVFDMTVESEFKKGRKIRTERNKLVEAINRKRLDVTEELKAKGDSLIVIVNGIYEPLVNAFELEDTKKKEEAKKLKEAHEKMIVEQRIRISVINDIAHSCRGANSQHISDSIEAIDLIDTDIFHKDIIHEAIEVKKQSLANLTLMLTDAISREKLDAEREEMEVMRKKMAEQQAEIDRQNRELQEPTEAEALREMQQGQPEAEEQPAPVKSRSIAGLSPKRTRPLTDIEQAYFDGFMSGYNQQESLINPGSEARSLAVQYAKGRAAA